jgi:hypothetical protein
MGWDAELPSVSQIALFKDRNLKVCKPCTKFGSEPLALSTVSAHAMTASHHWARICIVLAELSHFMIAIAYVFVRAETRCHFFVHLGHFFALFFCWTGRCFGARRWGGCIGRVDWCISKEGKCAEKHGELIHIFDLLESCLIDSLK